MNFKPILLAAAMVLAGSAHAAMSAQNSDDVLPNSPRKEHGMPDAGTFNPNAPAVAEERGTAVVAIPTAQTYRPAVVVTERARKPYALVASPTLPCAPAYCPRRVRVDRN